MKADHGSRNQSGGIRNGAHPTQAPAIPFQISGRATTSYFPFSKEPPTMSTSISRAHSASNSSMTETEQIETRVKLSMEAQVAVALGVILGLGLIGLICYLASHCKDRIYLTRVERRSGKCEKYKRAKEHRTLPSTTYDGHMSPPDHSSSERANLALPDSFLPMPHFNSRSITLDPDIGFSGRDPYRRPTERRTDGGTESRQYFNRKEMTRLPLYTEIQSGVSVGDGAALGPFNTPTRVPPDGIVSPPSTAQQNIAFLSSNSLQHTPVTTIPPTSIEPGNTTKDVAAPALDHSLAGQGSLENTVRRALALSDSPYLSERYPSRIYGGSWTSASRENVVLGEQIPVRMMGSIRSKSHTDVKRNLSESTDGSGGSLGLRVVSNRELERLGVGVKMMDRR